MTCWHSSNEGSIHTIFMALDCGILCTQIYCHSLRPHSLICWTAKFYVFKLFFCIYLAKSLGVKFINMLISFLKLSYYNIKQLELCYIFKYTWISQSVSSDIYSQICRSHVTIFQPTSVAERLTGSWYLAISSYIWGNASVSVCFGLWVGAY